MGNGSLGTLCRASNSPICRSDYIRFFVGQIGSPGCCGFRFGYVKAYSTSCQRSHSSGGSLAPRRCTSVHHFSDLPRITFARGLKICD